jgi:IclR family transcriptional regulator, mhp operon transcriptional activator
MSLATDTSMRGVARTLAVIRALNARNGARVTHLSLSTGIPRPSLYRILETLCELGYVRRRGEDERYELTVLVRSLSEGFSDEDWISMIAMPALRALQKKIVWPTDLATFFDNAMFMRETTRQISPLTIDRVRIGERLPLLVSATGQAYLANCDSVEREAILKNLAKSTDPGNALARDRRYVSSLIARTRRNGYGQRHGEVYAGTGAIAVPVMHGDRVIACLNITFIASVLSVEEAASRYLGMLRDAAEDISRKLSANGPRSATAPNPPHPPDILPAPKTAKAVQRVSPRRAITKNEDRQ